MVRSADLDDSVGGPIVTCRTCGVTIQSKYRHDFVACACPSESETQVCVDGGSDCFWFGCGAKAAWTERAPDGGPMTVSEMCRQRKSGTSKKTRSTRTPGRNVGDPDHKR